MDGILLIDKPAGHTSHDVIARVRRIIGQRRVGHTGTLDPFATGLLVVLVGRATRLAQFLSGAEKEYDATVRFGFATDTGDLTGRMLGDLMPCPRWTVDDIERAIEGLRGEIQQVPPMFSAKKVEGKKLYELARKGETIERTPVNVTINKLALKTALLSNDDGTCCIELDVVCSAGTYVRTLAESIGERLGIGAHLAALRRVRAGRFDVTNACPLAEIEKEMEREKKVILVSMNSALSHLPVAHLSAEDVRLVRHGAAVRPVDLPNYLEDGDRIRLCGGELDLLGVGVYKALEGTIQPRVMLAVDDK
jgi:tRNA pseudouridine55 synthase